MLYIFIFSPLYISNNYICSVIVKNFLLFKNIEDFSIVYVIKHCVVKTVTTSCLLLKFSMQATSKQTVIAFIF